MRVDVVAGDEVGLPALVRQSPAQPFAEERIMPPPFTWMSWALDDGSHPRCVGDGDTGQLDDETVALPLDDRGRA